MLRLTSPSSGLTTLHEIGHYNGEVQLPDATFLITIHADGSWALTRG